MIGRREILWGMFWLAVVGSTGCSLFDTRDPEAPEDGSAIDLSLATDPDTVLVNIEKSVEALLATSYASQFAEGFSVIPDLVDEAEFPTFWSKELEEQVHVSVFDGVDSATLEWGDAGDPVIDGDLQFFDDLSYSLTFVQGQEQAVFSGTVDLYMIELANSTFQVIRWEDLSDGSGNPTWGRLRIDRAAF